jgi:hypothetical protein
MEAGMTPNPRAVSMVGLLVLSLSFAGCSSSHFETPEVQGPAAMVDDGGQPRLWVVSKQEEVRQVGVPGGGSRSTMHWRSDTFFHFEVQAFDPLAAKPLWKKRLLTIGDPEAKGFGPSRVIGSAVEARLLGQDGGLVWLLIGDAPFAVSAADGSVVADGAALQRINPALNGLLPSEAKHYGFDRGLVLMAADARQFVIRGPEHEAAAYTPSPPPAPPEGRLQANGTREIVPTPPFGDVPARQVTLQGKWLGLYSEKEAADAGNDEWGRNLRWPYTVINEGRLARRAFWRAKIVAAQRFDDRFERLAELTPVAGGPTFLNGRFAKDQQTGEPRVLDDPAGILVWHSTRIDDAGRLALTRLDADLKPVWSTELPLSEPDTVRRVATWYLPGHLVVTGVQQVEDAGVTRREPYLVSVDLKSGALHASKLME